MKKILFTTLICLFGSCSDYKIIDTTLFKGIVSDKDVTEPEERVSGCCVIYIQNSKQTKSVLIPYENKDEYKIGDTAIMIIQQVEQK